MSLAPAENGQYKPAASIGFENADTFALLQRAAKLLSDSTLVPAQYRSVKEIKEYGKVVRTEENPNAIANCVIALNIARRMRADELMVMQNLYVVEGRPSWSSQWVIAAVNTCGKFSPLRFEITDFGSKEVEYSVTEWEAGKKKISKVKQTIQNLQCIAWVTERASGERLEGPPVTMEMAVQEGWYSKNGSKWQTMAPVMLRYRAASFFGKLYAPELLMGLPTAEEVHDEPAAMREVTGREVPAAEVPRLFSGVADNAAPATADNAVPMASSGESASASAPRKQSRAAAGEKKAPAVPASEQAAAPSEGGEPSAEPGPMFPREEFWARVDAAGMDSDRVMGILKKNMLTEGEFPADLTNDEASRIAPLWGKLVATYKQEGGAK